MQKHKVREAGLMLRKRASQFRWMPSECGEDPADSDGISVAVALWPIWDDVESAEALLMDGASSSSCPVI